MGAAAAAERVRRPQESCLGRRVAYFSRPCANFWLLAAGSATVLLLGIPEDSSVLLGGVVGFGLLVGKLRQPLAIIAATR
jgi:hypothetical protein